MMEVDNRVLPAAMWFTNGKSNPWLFVKHCIAGPHLEPD